MLYRAEAGYKYIQRPVHSGKGTAYSGAYEIDKTGKNACQFNAKALPDQWNKYYAALNEADWKRLGGVKGVCGRCLEVKGVNGETTRGHRIRPVVVKVVDLCPSWACDKGNVDFSSVALKAITGYSWDKKKIKWRFTDCPGAPSKPSTPSKTPPKPPSKAPPKAPPSPRPSSHHGFESEEAYDIYSQLEE